MTTPNTKAYVDAFQAEHRELHEHLHALSQAFESGARIGWTLAATAQAVEQFQRLRQHLKAHFAQEEEGGYLDEALVQAPRYSHQAEALLRQHGELLADWDALCADAQKEHANPNAWPGIVLRTQATLKQLKAHEAGENQIVQQAFNLDFDAAD